MWPPSPNVMVPDAMSLSMPDSVIETSRGAGPASGLAALSCQSRAPQSAVVSSVKVLVGRRPGVAGIVGQRGRHRDQLSA